MKQPIYKYEVIAVNKKTGEENPVCKVRFEGDLNNILHGLEKAVIQAEIKYKTKKL